MSHKTAFATTCFVLFAGVAWCAAMQASQGEKGRRYASDRNAISFIGATRIVLEGFDATDKDAKSATLQLDKNALTFSVFGDAQITTVFYKPFPVELTALKIADPAGKDRRIFAVALPKEQAEGLGKNSVRLVAPANAKGETPAVRLLLVNPEGKVVQAVELRLLSN
jgi:hypothetical protein